MQGRRIELRTGVLRGNAPSQIEIEIEKSMNRRKKLSTRQKKRFGRIDVIQMGICLTCALRAIERRQNPAAKRL
jgi:hypothetical protein